jgi:hypothetical protein
MKLRLFVFLLFICNITLSQNKHNFLLGGGLGFRYTSDDSNLESSNSHQNEEYLLQVNPAAGYFITKNLVIGIGVEYNYDKTNYFNYVYYNYRENGFSIAPFIRFYAPFGLFIHGEFDYGNSKSFLNGRPIAGATGYSTTSVRYNYNKVIGFSTGIGYRIKVNEVLGIEPSIRYLSSRFNEIDSKNDFSRKGFIVDMGMVYFIK